MIENMHLIVKQKIMNTYLETILACKFINGGKEVGMKREK